MELGVAQAVNLSEATQTKMPFAILAHPLLPLPGGGGPLWKPLQLHPDSLPCRRPLAVDVLRLPLTNVRILTRSPLARGDFDLYRTFGNRLLFGMSIPTLDDRLARLYEPKAPAPSKRLETLRLAAANGIPVYAAVAPTYPEQGESELAAVLGAIGRLNLNPAVEVDGS